jgi:hypothetical protein
MGAAAGAWQLAVGGWRHSLPLPGLVRNADYAHNTQQHRVVSMHRRADLAKRQTPPSGGPTLSCDVNKEELRVECGEERSGR